MDFKLLIITETSEQKYRDQGNSTITGVVTDFETSFAADSAASKIAAGNFGYRITVIKLY